MRKNIGITFVVLGLCLILFAIGLLCYNNYENRKAQEQANNILNSLLGMIPNNSGDEDPFDTEMKVVEIDGYGYVGYLSIPDFDLNLPVMSEWDYPRLRIAPCRYYGSTKTDNLVICAHNYKSHFGYIGNLAVNSTVVFTDMDGVKQNYRVTSVETLQPTQTKQVKDTGDELILYTCTYGG
ncbi:MAG: sortase, partial [Clostridia bacterium]|nr:sortase [Clostridia bacterium]